MALTSKRSLWLINICGGGDCEFLRGRFPTSRTVKFDSIESLNFSLDFELLLSDRLSFFLPTGESVPTDGFHKERTGLGRIARRFEEGAINQRIDAT